MEKCAFNIRVVNSDEVSKDQQKQGKAKSAVFIWQSRIIEEKMCCLRAFQ